MSYIVGVTVGEWAVAAGILFAALAYGIRETLDLLGRSPRASRLREENEDLLRINRELETTVKRHEQEIIRLTARVEELQVRDQKAVLEALAKHEVNADRRASVTAGLLSEIRDSLKEGVRA